MTADINNLINSNNTGLKILLFLYWVPGAGEKKTNYYMVRRQKGTATVIKHVWNKQQWSNKGGNTTEQTGTRQHQEVATRYFPNTQYSSYIVTEVKALTETNMQTVQRKTLMSHKSEIHV